MQEIEKYKQERDNEFKVGNVGGYLKKIVEMVKNIKIDPNWITNFKIGQKISKWSKLVKKKVKIG